MTVERINNSIFNYRKELLNHSLYSKIKDIEDLRNFTKIHVFAVWDFMSLLKALQNLLTTTKIPWTPNEDSASARLINQIIVDEESDLNYNGTPKSHFEMYLEAMEEIQANTESIKNFLNDKTKLEDIKKHIKNYNIDPYIKSFLNFSFQTIEGWKSHEIAAAFTFGREEIIPDMFLEIIEQTEKSNKLSFKKINYYLQRHIDLDGDEHGPLAHEMIIGLCKNDPRKWEEVIKVSKDALKERIQLWDFINLCIKDKNDSLNKIENPKFANA